jgi:hypothetical protein
VRDRLFLKEIPRVGNFTYEFDSVFVFCLYFQVYFLQRLAGREQVYVEDVADCTGVDDYGTAAAPPYASRPFRVAHPAVERTTKTPHSTRFLHNDFLVVMGRYKVPNQVIVIHTTTSDAFDIVVKRALLHVFISHCQRYDFGTSVEFARHSEIF